MLLFFICCVFMLPSERDAALLLFFPEAINNGMLPAETRSPRFYYTSLFLPSVNYQGLFHMTYFLTDSNVKEPFVIPYALQLKPRNKFLPAGFISFCLTKTPNQFDPQMLFLLHFWLYIPQIHLTSSFLRKHSQGQHSGLN